MQSGKIGKIGEDIAANHFAGLGYSILGRNLKNKFSEIDIVMKHRDRTLVFCEVKTLSINKRYEQPYENGFMPEDHLTRAKIQRLAKGANIFLARYPEALNEERGWRIDLVAIRLKGEIFFDLKHYENVY